MRGYLVSVLALALLITSAGASYSTSQVVSLLSSYNVSPTITGSLQYVNITYSGMDYVALYHSGAIFMVVNLSSTGGYSIVSNQSSIYNVIEGTVVSDAIQSFNLSTIRTSVHNYQDSTMPSIIACLRVVDINPSITCTASYCPACITNPIIQNLQAQQYCSPGAFVDGIISIDNNTPKLNATYLSFYSQLNSTNAENVSSRVQSLSSTFGSITSITNGISTLAMFPPPSNITNSEVSSCSTYIIPTQAPWYCQSTGFCGPVVANTSASTAVSLQLSQLSSKVSSSVISQQAQVAHNNAELFVEPVIVKEKSAVLRSVLNSTLAGYQQLVNGTQTLLTHISSPQLQGSLSNLTGSYSALLSSYLTENITAGAAVVKLHMGSLQAQYAALSANYLSAAQLSKNNTAMLFEAQLNSQVPSKEITSLSFQELLLNGMLQGSVGNITAVNAQLMSINRQAKAAGTGGGSVAFALTSAVDGPVVRALAPSLGLQYSQAVASAPLLSIIVPVVISLIVILLMFAYYHSLRRKRRVMLNHSTRRNWRMLFAVAVLVAIVWTISTYTSASQNASTLSMFSSALAQSSRAALIENGTSAGISSCAAQIQAKVTAMKKSLELVQVQGGRCTINGTLETTESCLGSIAESGIPAIILQNSSSDSMQVYSYYGTYLKASGDSSFIGQCYPAELIG